MEIYPLIFELEALTPLNFQQYAGIALRGGLGMSMKRALCVMDKDRAICKDCILAETCAYAKVFESLYNIHGKIMKKASHYPHPFVMTPLFKGPANYKKGDIFQVSFNLFGNSVKYLSYITHSFIKFGENGVGKDRGKFKVLKILNGHDHTLLYSDFEKIDFAGLNPLIIDKPSLSNKVKIEFRTPCRINKKGKMLKKAEFSDIIKNIVRRRKILGSLYCENSGERDKSDIIDKALKIKKISADLKWQQISRYSKRQGNRMVLEGFTGTAVFEGDMEPFYELLKIAEFMNIGKNSSFGFGAVKVSFI